jgi:biotin carboxylase
MMRDGAIRCLREIGVDTGGSNVQFAIHPRTGRMVIIEMNPRVSRSSALASKATGFPIAKIAAKLAVGYRLDEIRNDITRKNAGVFRAYHRLRCGEDSQVGLREVPGRGARAGNADEVRGRSDGHRPHLQGSALQRHAQPGDGQGLRLGAA